jgi:hypothetical protein
LTRCIGARKNDRRTMAHHRIADGVVQALCPNCGAPQEVVIDLRQSKCAYCQHEYLLAEDTLRAFREASKRRWGRRKRSTRRIDKAVGTADDTWIIGAGIFYCLVYGAIGAISAALEGWSLTPLGARMAACIAATVLFMVPLYAVARVRLARFWREMPEGAQGRVAALRKTGREDWTAALTAEVESLSIEAQRRAKEQEMGFLVGMLYLSFIASPAYLWWVAGQIAERLL